MSTLTKHWYCIFLILAFLLALFPPTIVPQQSPFDANPLSMGSATTAFISIFSEKHVLQQPNWPILFALEAPCLVAFGVFGLRRKG